MTSRMIVAAVFALATSAVPVGAQGAQEQKPPAGLTATEIMQKTLAAYSAAKSYQANWSYTLEQGEGAAKQTQKMVLEIRSKAPNQLLFRVAPAPDQKPAPGSQPLPELRVVVDGKTAWFENTSDKSFYKAALPKNAAISPLMFMPLIPSVSQVERKPDERIDGRTVFVLAATTPQGGTGRMEIDAQTFRIRRVSTEALLGLTKLSSSISMDKETFDGEVPESTFAYKSPRGFTETPAPPEIAGMFGAPDKK